MTNFSGKQAVDAQQADKGKRGSGRRCMRRRHGLSGTFCHEAAMNRQAVIQERCVLTALARTAVQTSKTH